MPAGPDGESLIRFLISKVSFMPKQFYRLSGSRSDLFAIMLLAILIARVS
jgi:hypothetical protein